MDSMLLRNFAARKVFIQWYLHNFVLIIIKANYWIVLVTQVSSNSWYKLALQRLVPLKLKKSP